MEETRKPSLLAEVATWVIMGAVALVALKLVLGVLGAVLGAAFGVLSFLLFTVAPFALAGWVVMKGVERLRRRDAPAD
ncbi:MAG TPA: hypothetical protein VF192_00250 [Longimicrobiales bacterium]